MSIDLNSILGLSSGATSSIGRLVAQYMALEKRPLDALKARRDQLDVRSGMFTDLKTKINELRTLAEDLASSDSDSIFKSHTVSSSDTDIATATSQSGASDGVYELSNIVLAKAQRVQSAKQTSTWTAGAGSFTVNGALVEIDAGKTLVEIKDAINNASFEVGHEALASVVDGILVLESKSPGTSNTINVSDLSGTVLSDMGLTTAVSNTHTSVYTDATDWDPGSDPDTWTRTFNLGGATTVNRLEWSRDVTGASTGETPEDYTLEYWDSDTSTWKLLRSVVGGSVDATTHQKEDSFYPVTTTQVRMTVTGVNSGTGPFMDNVELFYDTASYAQAALQTASNGSLEVNGIPIAGLNANTSLTTVIDGLSLDLKTAPGPVTITVANDTASMKSKITSFLTKLNSLMDYLKLKTETKKNTDGSYTRGPLNGYTLYTSLSSQMIMDVEDVVTGLAAGSPTQLSELGITMDDNLHFSLTDSAALESLLSANPNGVAEFFGSADGVATRILDRLDPYVEAPTTDSSSYLELEQDAIDSERDSLDLSITAQNERLALKEKSLTSQFTRLQALMIQAVQQQQQINTLFAGYY